MTRIGNPETFVEEQLLEAYGLVCEKFTKDEMRRGKTPDRRVYSSSSEFVFFLEVKEVARDGSLGGLKQDPIFNRLTDDIHTAMKQFYSVNSNVDHPNVLAIVNNDHMCGLSDLLAVLTGNFYADDDSTHKIYGKYSDGRIKDEKDRIHLFLWYDAFKPNRLLFSQTHEAHHETLCRILTFDPKDICQIPR